MVDGFRYDVLFFYFAFACLIYFRYLFSISYACLWYYTFLSFRYYYVYYVIPGVLTLLYIVTPLFPTDILFYMVIHHILSGVQTNYSHNTKLQKPTHGHCPFVHTGLCHNWVTKHTILVYMQIGYLNNFTSGLRTWEYPVFLPLN